MKENVVNIFYRRKRNVNMRKSKNNPFMGITLDESELENADMKLDNEMKKEMKTLGITNEEEYAKYLDNKIKNENPKLYQIMQEYFKKYNDENNL